MLKKNPGPILRSVFRGAIDLIPREFRAKLGFTQTVQQQPTDVDASVPDGISLVESKVEQERTDERKKTDTHLVGDLTNELVSEVKLKDGQTGTVTRSLVPEGTPLNVDSSFTEATQTNLGNSFLDQTVITQPETLPLPKFTTEIPDVIPEKFRVAVPKVTEAETVDGTAVTPVLQPGDLMRSEEQLDLFTKRTTVEGRAGITVPVTLAGGKETNAQKQVVTVNETYRDVGVDSLPTAVRDVTVEQLGAGRVIETTKTIPTVFPGKVFETAFDQSLPPEFKATFPTRKEEITETGTVTGPPTLGFFDLSKRVTQVDLFNKRTETVIQDQVVYPTTLVDRYFGGVEVGGSTFSGIVYRLRTLNVGISDPDVGFNQIKSEIRSLDSGQTLKETDTLNLFPTLKEYQTDDDNVTTILTKTLVTTGSVPSADNTDQKDLDSQRAVRIVKALDGSGLQPVSLRRIFEGKIDVELPAQLLSINAQVNKSSGAGSYSESGTYTLAVNGSGGIAEHGSARGNAAVLTDVSYDIKEPWSHDVPCIHYLFYLSWSLLETVGILTYVNNIRGATTLAWPKFAPRNIVLVCFGQSIRGETLGNINAHDSINTDYLGVVRKSGLIRVTGFGASKEVELTQKTIRIPPTIHPTLNLNLGGQTFSVGFLANGSMSVAGISVDTSEMTVGGTAAGDYSQLTFPGTPGQQTIPTSGVYLYKTFVEPYKLGYAKVHAITVDFANIL